MKPCQHPGTGCTGRILDVRHVLAHDCSGVTGNIKPVLNRFCRRMRAAYSGLMSDQLPDCPQLASMALMASAYVDMICLPRLLATDPVVSEPAV